MADGASSVTPAGVELLDIVDLGLTQHFLGGETAAALLASARCVVSLSCDAQHIAFGMGERVLIQRQLVPDKPRLVNLPAGDAVRSICWLSLALPPEPRPVSVLLVGGESGRLGAYTHLGTPLWSAWPHDAPLMQIVPHTGGPASELLCLHEGGVLAHAEGAALHAALLAAAAAATDGSLEALDVAVAVRDAAAAAAAASGGGGGGGRGGGGGGGGGGARDELFCSLWLAQGARCQRVVCAGPLPQLPLEFEAAAAGLRRSDCAEPPLCLALSGSGATGGVLALHLADLAAARAERRGALGGVAAAAGGALGALFSHAPGLGLGLRARLQSGAQRVADGVHALGTAGGAGAPSGESECVRVLADARRVHTSLCLEPRNRRWLAATDTLGRVALLESRTLVALRLWKGYRDAQCGWSVWEGGVGAAGGAGAAASSVLVIYAPRRGLLELWRVPSGGRLAACSVGVGCRLFSPPPPLAPTDDDDDASAPGGEGRRPRCFLLQPSGSLHRVAVGGK